MKHCSLLSKFFQFFHRFLVPTSEHIVNVGKFHNLQNEKFNFTSETTEKNVCKMTSRAFCGNWGLSVSGSNLFSKLKKFSPGTLSEIPCTAYVGAVDGSNVKQHDY